MQEICFVLSQEMRGPHLVAYGPGIVGSKPDLDQDLGSITDKNIYSSFSREKLEPPENTGYNFKTMFFFPSIL